MTKKLLLMGNEAIARGAVEAGIQVATAYPGTPSTEIFATLARFAKENNFYAEWSVNEKAALEVAAGAAYAGARAIVSMKQVGLNVASDPLMTLAYIGVKGGLVLVVADDPGPHSSQTEQDTRKFAQFAKLPVFDPCSPEEAKEMTLAAFELSERTQLPVILRPTTRTCHVCQDVALGTPRAQNPVRFERDPAWVILPSLAYKKHIWLNRQQEVVRQLFSQSPFNRLEGKGRIGIITSGVSYNYVKEALEDIGLEALLLKIGTPYPLPAEPVLELLRSTDRVLVVEEQEPVVEDQVIALAWKYQLPTEISGKHDGRIPREGELGVTLVRGAVAAHFKADLPADPPAAIQGTGFERLALPERAPILCAGCPHRASFYAFSKEARKHDAIFTGDIGCYTLGAVPPLSATDTCLCMGASVTIASGLAAVDKSRKHIAFLGDSTFFHSGLAGLINAVYNNANITLVVLDNSTTAMTGHQPHPGLDMTATGVNEKHIDIASVAHAIGVELVMEVDPFDLNAARWAARETMNFTGPSVVVMKRECIAIVKHQKTCRVNEEKCTGCNLCVNDLGCPALIKGENQVTIGSSCTGCSLCGQVCRFGAIEEVQL